jgi:predicted short-subunit dehydrogenase-like oxidoreductase (DUF2520 family)
MTFNSDLYDLPTYRQIPFVVERGGPSFSSILPSFDNPAFELPEEQTALYHAWAVLAGSATASTWREYRRVASKTLGLPEHVLHPYLKQVARNSLDLDAPMTGPVARADGEAIASNLEALLGSPYQGLYRELVKIFAPEEH